MRKSIALILGELDNKVGGYVALLQFRYSNLCVKADPCSLLPVTVNYDDNDYDIEDVAYVRLLKEDQLQVYPKDSALLLYIGKAIAEYHPEFKQEIVAEKDPREVKKMLRASGSGIVVGILMFVILMLLWVIPFHLS